MLLGFKLDVAMLVRSLPVKSRKRLARDTSDPFATLMPALFMTSLTHEVVLLRLIAGGERERQH